MSKYFRPLYIVLASIMVSFSHQYTPPQCIGGTPPTTPNTRQFPSLPDEFQSTIEVNDIVKSSTVTVQEYNAPGNRASLRIVSGGTIHTQVFSYNTNEVYTIIGDACTVSAILGPNHNPKDTFFGDVNVTGVPHLFTFGGALPFNNAYGQHYLGTATIRGIQTEHWQSCQLSYLNYTLTLDYYFTASGWSDDVNYVHAPVRMISSGVQLHSDGTTSNVTHYYDYMAFKPYITDRTVFNTPDDVVCTGRVQQKDVPQLPPYYHTKLEYIDEQPIVYILDQWYDGEKKLFRYDSANNTLHTPTSLVSDFNAGVQYTIDKGTGKCTTGPISPSSVASKVNIADGTISMKSVSETLHIDANFTYVGQRMVRGLSCDLFSGTIVYPDGSTFVVQYYFLADGIQQYPDDVSDAPTAVPVKTILTSPEIGKKITVNIVDYDIDRPDYSKFDVSDCYSDSAKLQIQIKFQGQYKSGIMGQLRTVGQTKIVAALGVSPMRVQHVKLDYDNSFIYLSATLLDKAPYAGTVNPRGKPEINVTQAYTQLTYTVFSGSLQIQAFLSYLKEPLVFKAVDVSISNGQLFLQSTPQFSAQFSYHLENTVPSIHQVLNAHIWYDYQYQLVRYDTTNGVPKTAIHDYNNGLAYTINKQTGYCVVEPITNSSFDVAVPTGSQQAKTGYVLKLKNPLQMFDLTQNAKYVGQKTIRGILCDVYEYSNTFNFGGVVKPAIFQFYFMTRQWHELSEVSGIPVPNQPVRLIVTPNDASDSEHFDIFDFNKQHPDLTNFDIRPCFTGDQRSQFVIKFNQRYHPTLDTNLAIFEKSIQEKLSVVTGVSPLRFQNPEIIYDGAFTYYIATVVEQAPYILDFTKTSNKEGVYSSDGSMPGVSSDIACAAICRTISGLRCESFDYCSSTKLCQLSTKHTADGKLLKSSVVCDHYSKTVDLPIAAKVEPNMDQILTILQDRISRGLLNVTVQPDVNTSVTYPPVNLQRNILRRETESQSSEILENFNMLKHQAILKSPIASLYGLSVDECASRCLLEVSFECQSVTVCPDMELCILSDIRPSQNMSAVNQSQICDIYTRKYTDYYVKYKGIVTSTLDGVQIIDTSGSADVCALQCQSYTGFPCKSFDYCANSHICNLKPTHILELAPTDTKSNFTCSHYSKKYVFDFTKTSKRSLITGQTLTFFNVTTEQCAKLCVENDGYLCKSFTYCTDTASCTIVSSQTNKVQSQITNSSTCDLFTRRYYPDFRPGNGPLPSSTPQPLQQNTGYSAGAMAGIAIGMLVPGMVLGAALLWFIRTKKLVERHQLHEMKVVRTVLTEDS